MTGGSAEHREQWSTRTGFILAAAGSAVGLGNIWKFPYVTGEHGGGAFLLIYLGCVVLIGAPVLIAELLLGRATRSSAVNAFRSGQGPRSVWIGFGILAVLAALSLLSYYSTVAGWSLHYTYLSATGQATGIDSTAVQGLFDHLIGSDLIAVAWQLGFLLLTVVVVGAGVTGGLERCARVLMPALAALMLLMLVKATTMPGWAQGVEFLFGMRFESVTGAGVLEALGQSFFTLSVGMGTMLTYGSYLSKKQDMVSAGLVTTGADTLIALVASMVVFPIVFSFGLDSEAGPQLLFVTMPTAFAQMPGGVLLSVAFFLILAFAAFTSAISLLEVVVAYLEDNHRISRRTACWAAGGLIALLGIPATVNEAWFEQADFLVSNVALPLGGLGVALFVAWGLDRALVRDEFLAGSSLGGLFRAWLWMLKYPVPAAIVLVFLRGLGVV